MVLDVIAIGVPSLLLLGLLLIFAGVTMAVLGGLLMIPPLLVIKFFLIAGGKLKNKLL